METVHQIRADLVPQFGYAGQEDVLGMINLLESSGQGLHVDYQQGQNVFAVEGSAEVAVDQLERILRIRNYAMWEPIIQDERGPNDDIMIKMRLIFIREDDVRIDDLIQRFLGAGFFVVGDRGERIGIDPEEQQEEWEEFEMEENAPPEGNFLLRCFNLNWLI